MVWESGCHIATGAKRCREPTVRDCGRSGEQVRRIPDGSASRLPAWVVLKGVERFLTLFLAISRLVAAGVVGVQVRAGSFESGHVGLICGSSSNNRSIA